MEKKTIKRNRNGFGLDFFLILLSGLPYFFNIVFEKARPTEVLL